VGTGAPKPRRSRRPRQPWHYVLLAGVFFVVAVAAISVIGVLAEHHVGKLVELPAAVMAGALVGAAAMLRIAYVIGVRDPAMGRQLQSAAHAVAAGEEVPGSLAAALRKGPPDDRRPRWRQGRVRIAGQSVTWRCRGTGGERDLTGGEFTSERRVDLAYREMTLRLPDSWTGADVRVVTLQVNGEEMELAAPAQVLEIIRRALAGTGGPPVTR
jgi:hypothetical protein